MLSPLSDDIISIDFDYVVGTPDYQNYEVSEVLNLHSNSIDCVPYGVTHNVDLEKSILIPAEAESTHFRTIISGWGHATPTDSDGRPCAEWCYRTHEIKINNFPTKHIPKAHYAKGSYFSLEGKSPFQMLVYPVPLKNTAGLGVHATIDMQNRTKFGPDVEWLDEPDLTN